MEIKEIPDFSDPTVGKILFNKASHELKVL